ncbi:PilC/PilY family type IV pilus protein [Pleionea litopenaei]|uniref:PilC/PilY family type IV pilus protein n=1 Tax=Pleionea litopenaei TaxID=3070815 RepID=A0AA51RU60_9GAMM|nr:PilC/PilY family type IV pilus protein [Pleionea sp. HL-JVS1]WMS87575.1 PilC/PilY family type IV pilus protein [Pleionea sp. HL-JVS1]
MFKKQFFKVAACTGMYALACMNSVYADDTEIFFNGTNAGGATPNVLFIFDTSGSMNRNASGSNESRIDVMRDVMYEFITDIEGLNIGMARFSVPGGPILNAVFNVDAATDPVAISQVNSNDDDATENFAGNKMAYNAAILEFNEEKATDLMGLRFTDLDIPQGAIITSATITVSSYNTITGSPVFEILGEKVGNADTFTGDKLSDRLTSNPTANSVKWAPGDWIAPSPLYDADGLVPPSSYSTVDLAPLVQEIVNQGDWCGSNSMAFFIRAGQTQAALRDAIAHDGNPLYAPRIRIEFDADPQKIQDNTEAVNNAKALGNPVGCYVNQANRQISDGAYDIEYPSTGGYYDSGTILDFNSTGNGRRNRGIGLHFDNILVPQGAEIEEAYIEIVADNPDNGNAQAVIKFIDAVNAPATANGIFSSPKLGGVSWTLPNFESNITYESPSLVSQIESLTGNAGWVAGNGMSVYIETNSGNRDVISFESSAVRAPRLVIKYRGSYDGTGYTKRDEMKQVVQDFQASGNTPISDTLLEAGLYYRGEEVLYGKVRGTPSSRNNRISNPNSFDPTGVVYTPSGCDGSDPNANACKDERVDNDPNYVTPIVDGCQKNHIVLLTDGEPTSHDYRTQQTYSRWSGGWCSGNRSGRDCAIKIAGFLANNDQNNKIAGDQTVKTHVIGFDYDSEFLEDVANAGGGFYFTANDKAGLLAKLKEIANSILKTNTTFVSAGLTVNQYNRLTHNDQLYYSLFQPGETKSWVGNMKRYRLSDGLVVDVNGNPAVDVLNGEFTDTARSWWSDSVDGNEVGTGGVAGEQQIGRTLYTNVTGDSTTAASNRIDATNLFITKELLKADDDADALSIKRWALGYDVSDASLLTPHQIIGDPLHSRPTLLSYNRNGNEYTAVFVGTNNGYLHAFEAESGKELWSFVPKDLLPLLKEKKENNPISAGTAHPYGVDGEITIYLDDKNSNSAADSGESVYLFVGLRRGGKSYYAFDITNPLQPNLLYKINPDENPDFAKLGQSWSKPVIGKMNIGGQTERLVMIFGAGYDPVHDTAGVASQNVGQGNAVYIADAKTGKYLWDSSKAGSIPGNGGSVSSMNSVPSNVKAFDLDDDGLLDHFYVSDNAGQIFRFDIDNDSGSIKGGRLAKLQSGATAQENRRFFTSPDVALVRDTVSGETFVSVSIGSGYRAHPLDTELVEHMYSLRDKGVLSKQIVKDIGLVDLIKQTFADSDGDGTYDTTETLGDVTADKHGWYYDFPTEGEKVMADSLTFNNALLFTTYTPPPLVNNSGSCVPAAGSSRIYALAVSDGTPYVDINYDGTIDENDLYIDLPGAGIAPEPQVILTEEGNGVRGNLCVGRKCDLDELLPTPPKRMVPIKWRHILN